MPKHIQHIENFKAHFSTFAPGIKLAQEVYDASNALTKKTDYLDGFIYENDELQLIQHEEGRIVPDATTGNFDYQYHLKDHLGNTRLTFTTEPKEIIFSVNYENDADNPDDIALFEGVSISDMEEFNHTQGTYTDDTPYSHAQVLKSSPHHQVGSVIALPVGKGDEINARVFGKYVDANADPNVPAITLATALVSAFTGAAVGATDNGVSTINNNFDAGTLIGSAGFPYNSQAPKAYLNLLFLPGSGTITLVKDETFAYKQLHQDAKEDVVGDALKDPFDELLIENFEVPGNGYVLIYVSNEGALNDVFFDDLEIRVNEYPVIQRDDFYPFGLTFNSFQRITTPPNRYMFNGKERIDDLDLNWDDFGVRMYMPEIGRWGVIDPLADQMIRHSPYNYAFDNPIRFIDPDGMAPLDIFEEQEDGSFKRVQQDNSVVDQFRHRDGTVTFFNKETGELSGRINVAAVNDKVVQLNSDNGYDQKAGEVLVSGSGGAGVLESEAKAEVITGEIDIDGMTNVGGSTSAKTSNVATALAEGLSKVAGVLGEFKFEKGFKDSGDSAVVQFSTESKPGVRSIITPGGGFGRRREADVTKEDSLKHKIIPRR